MITGKTKEYIDVVQKIFTVLGIIAAAIWFFLQGEYVPKGNISQKVTYRKLNSENYWVQLGVTISNKGKRNLNITSSDIRLQQILPLANNYTSATNAKMMCFINKTTYRGPWKIIHRYVSNLKVSVRPGEEDNIYFEFIVPVKVKTIKLYSYFEAVKGQGWTETTIVDLKETII